MYAVGLDVGTTFTTVAIWRDGDVSTLPRLERVPSRVLVAPDGRLIAGAEAERYLDDSAYVALTGVVGKLGDPGPIVVHGREFSVEGVVGALVRGVIVDVGTEQGEPPAAVAICHPGDWGTFTTNLLSWAVTLADLRPRHGVQLITVPEAVAVEASRHIDIPEGALFGVHDFGGRSFTAAVMRRTADGFDTLGAPVRLPDLGGHDLDEALMQHVIIASGRGRAAHSIPERGLVALREACRRARTDLLTEAATSVAVAMPGDATATQVTVTRAELDDLTRPMLAATLDALRRSAASAGVSVDDFEMVLMIGGATDLPAMAAVVWDELRIPPVVLDQPELAAARGAAWVCGGLAVAGTQGAVDDPAEEAAVGSAVVEPAVVGVESTLGSDEVLPDGEEVAAEEVGDAPLSGDERTDEPRFVDEQLAPARVTPPVDATLVEPLVVAPSLAAFTPVGDPDAWTDESSADTDRPPSRRRVVTALLAVAAGIAVLGGLGAAAFLVVRDDTVAAGTCPAAQADGPWVCVTSAAVTGGRLKLSLTTYLVSPPSVVAARIPLASTGDGARVQLFGSVTAAPAGLPATVLDVDELAAELSLDYNLVAEPRAAQIANLPFVCAQVTDAAGALLVRDEPTVDCAAIAAAGDVDITVPPQRGLTPPPTPGSGLPTSAQVGSATDRSAPVVATPGRSTRNGGTARATAPSTPRSPSASRPPSTPRSVSTASGSETPPPVGPDPSPPLLPPTASTTAPTTPPDPPTTRPDPPTTTTTTAPGTTPTVATTETVTATTTG